MFKSIFFILFLLFIFLYIGYLIGNAFGLFITRQFYNTPSKTAKSENTEITINNYTTEQHLHISDDSFKNLSKN